MRPIEPYRESVAPPSEQCFALTLKPLAWKARMWRTFDDSVFVMARLEAPLTLRDLTGEPIHALLKPFGSYLTSVIVYLERGASVPLPLPWSIGRLSIERAEAVAFLHRVLDDPLGASLATLMHARDARADIVLSLSPYEVEPDRLVFAVRDYDIGVGGGPAR